MLTLSKHSDSKLTDQRASSYSNHPALVQCPLLTCKFTESSHLNRISHEPNYASCFLHIILRKCCCYRVKISRNNWAQLSNVGLWSHLNHNVCTVCKFWMSYLHVHVLYVCMCLIMFELVVLCSSACENVPRELSKLFFFFFSETKWKILSIIVPNPNFKVAHELRYEKCDPAFTAKKEEKK